MHPLIREVQKTQEKPVPQIKPGYTVIVYQKVKEGEKERVQKFEGLVIKVSHGEGVQRTITVRKVLEGVGVEKVIPVHSPTIEKIEVRKKAKVRRSKLYYMRQRSGKSARLQEKHVSDQERAEEEARMKALIDEAVQANKKQEAKEETEPADQQPAAEANKASEDQQSEQGAKQAQEKPTEEAKSEAPKEEAKTDESKEDSKAEDQPKEDKPQDDKEESKG